LTQLQGTDSDKIFCPNTQESNLSSKSYIKVLKNTYNKTKMIILHKLTLIIVKLNL